MFLNPRDILSHLSITANAKVGDFGVGAGHYSFALAEKLGAEGTIYAFDAFGPVLDAIRRKGEHYPAEFHTLQSDLNEPIPIAENLLHIAVVANILHQIRERERFVMEVARVVRPQGTVLVVDWISSFKNMGPSPEAVLAPGEAVRLFRQAGFDTGDMLPAGTHHFAFLATLRE
ncbi:MAG: methyltransferase domain-containing protein [Candidatus Paceibacterota bacterium]